MQNTSYSPKGKMKKPGAKGAPSAADFKKAAKTAKKGKKNAY